MLHRVVTLNIVRRQPLKSTYIDDAVWVTFGRPYSLETYHLIFRIITIPSETCSISTIHSDNQLLWFISGAGAAFNPDCESIIFSVGYIFGV